MSNTNKLEYISQIRVLSLFMIVFYHCICFYLGRWGLPCADKVTPLWSVIAPSMVNIGLTNYVLISGFLYSYLYRKGKYHNLLSFIKGKTLRLLIPYFVWSLFIIYLIPGSGQRLSGMLYGINHLWFLLMLFELFLIVSIANVGSLLESSSKNVDVLIFALSFFPVFFTKYILDSHYPLALELTMKYLPVFLLGYYIAKYSILERMSSLLKGSLLIVGGGILCILTSNDIDLNSEWFAFASALVGLSLMAMVKSCSLSVSFVSWLDASCMGIYLLNQIVIYYLLLNDGFRHWANQHEYIGPLVIFVISFGLPLLMTKLLGNFKWSRYIIG